MAITVLVADPSPARRRRCARLLAGAGDVRVVGEIGRAFDAVAALRRRPRIALVDLGLLRGHGSALLPLIRQASPATRVILLTERAREATLLRALAAGAPAYLERRLLARHLVKAVRVVDEGEAWIPRRLVGKIVRRVARLAA